MSKKFLRFGNMMPPQEMMRRPYLLYEEPFNIIGNTYFVGNTWCSSHLIDTGDGLILLDTALLSHLGMLLDSIWKLGFDPRDIKYVIVSHSHLDHYGCVKALKYLTGAQVAISQVDMQFLRDHVEIVEKMHQRPGMMAELFAPDIELEDFQHIQLGNVDIECVLTPGHTVGVMSHFWQTSEDGKTYNVGIYGGAGFISLSKAKLQEAGLPLSIQEEFVKSIDKVWDRKVDVMLGNHPFHNDTFEKKERVENGEKTAFIDPGEWHRYLTELKSDYQAYLKLTPEEIEKMYEKSSLLVFRDRAVPYLEDPLEDMFK